MKTFIAVALVVLAVSLHAAPFPSKSVSGQWDQLSIWEMTADDGPQTGGAIRRFAHHIRYGTYTNYVSVSGVRFYRRTDGVDADASSPLFFDLTVKSPGLGTLDQSPSIGLVFNGGAVNQLSLQPGESWFIRIFTAPEGTTTGEQTVLIRYTDPQYGPEIAMKSFPHTFTNAKNYPVKWVLFDKDDNILANATVQPGNTATFTSAFSVPTSLASQGPFVAKVFVPANLADGGWVEADLEDGDDFTISPAPTGTDYIAGGTPPLTPVVNYGVPDGTPTKAPPSNGEKPVWSTEGDTGALSNGVYKQGVEKQIAELSGINEAMAELNATTA